MTTPARRLSPAVYRRRRLVLLGVLVAIVALVVVLIVQPWRGGAAAPVAATSPAVSASPTPSATPAATPPAAAPSATAAATPAAPRACTSADLTVEALTDAGEYPPGQNPQLSLRLTNVGAVDCTMNVGTTGQTFTVTSGSDVWWRSTDCQTDSADQIVTLTAGQSVTSTAPVVWDRTRSSVDTCGSAREAAPGGGATYRLSVSIGGVPSASSAVFTLD